MDADQWWQTVEVNLGGAVTHIRLTLPGMVAGQGRIINITSNAGVYRCPLMSAYAASKATLGKLTETLAAETRQYGASVFSVDPGILPIGLGNLALTSTAARAPLRDRSLAGSAASRRPAGVLSRTVPRASSSLSPVAGRTGCPAVM